VTVLAAASIALAAIAVVADRNATTARNQALSRQVAIEAQQLEATDPSLAAQLAVAAYRIAPTLQARSTLVGATSGEIPTRLVGPKGPTFVSVAAAAPLLAVARSATDTVAVYRLGTAIPTEVAVVRAGPPTSQDFAVAYSPSGDLLAAAGGNGTLAVWPAGDPSPQVAPAPDTATIETLAFSPDGSTLVTGGDDLALRVWHVTSSGLPEPAGPVLTPATSQLFSVAFSPHGRQLAVGSADGSIHLYDTGSDTGSGTGSDTGSDTSSWTAAGGFEAPNPVTGVAFASSSELVSADSGGVTRLWSLPDPTTDTEPGRVYALAYDTSGAHLFAGSSGPQGDATIWDVEGPLRLAVAGTVVPPASFGPVAGAVASSPNGRLVAVANAQAAIQLFDTADPSAPRPLGPTLHGNEPYIEELDFSPNGRVLAASDDSGQVRMWDIADPHHPQPLGPPLTGPTGDVYAIAVSPNGTMLAAATTSHAVWLWDIADPAHPRLEDTLAAGPAEVFAVAFSPDGRTLVASGSDDTLHLWQVHPSDAERRICSLAGTPITPAEWAHSVQAPYRPPCR
jgi:WD40 repeat protein